MFKTVFLILLLSHILGDYYFQSDNLSRRKISSVACVTKHCIIYGITCIVVIIPVFSKSMLLASVLSAICHTIIDLLKYFYIKSINGKNEYTSTEERFIYLVDQITHLISMMAIGYVFTAGNHTITLIKSCSVVFSNVGLSGQKVFLWMLVLLLIYKPTNITIKKVLMLYKPTDKNEENEKRAGGFIGTLERLVIIALLSISQYSAIGLILTAKSIARYDKISKDQEFAEYYLIGTLISTLMVICFYLLIIYNS